MRKRFKSREISPARKKGTASVVNDLTGDAGCLAGAFQSEREEETPD
jgi:hypothetical protein